MRFCLFLLRCSAFLLWVPVIPLLLSSSRVHEGKSQDRSRCAVRLFERQVQFEKSDGSLRSQPAVSFLVTPTRDCSSESSDSALFDAGEGGRVLTFLLDGSGVPLLESSAVLLSDEDWDWEMEGEGEEVATEGEHARACVEEASESGAMGGVREGDGGAEDDEEEEEEEDLDEEGEEEDGLVGEVVLTFDGDSLEGSREIFLLKETEMRSTRDRDDSSAAQRASQKVRRLSQRLSSRIDPGWQTSEEYAREESLRNQMKEKQEEIDILVKQKRFDSRLAKLEREMRQLNEELNGMLMEGSRNIDSHSERDFRDGGRNSFTSSNFVRTQPFLEPLEFRCSDTELIRFLRRVSELWSPRWSLSEFGPEEEGGVGEGGSVRGMLDSVSKDLETNGKLRVRTQRLTGFLLSALVSLHSRVGLSSHSSTGSGSVVPSVLGPRVEQKTDRMAEVVLNGRRASDGVGGQRKGLYDLAVKGKEPAFVDSELQLSSVTYRCLFPLAAPLEGRDRAWLGESRMEEVTGLEALRMESASLWVDELFFSCFHEEVSLETVRTLLEHGGIPPLTTVSMREFQEFGSVKKLVERESSLMGRLFTSKEKLLGEIFNETRQSRGEAEEKLEGLWDASFPDTKEVRRFLSSFLASLQDRNLKFVDPFFSFTNSDMKRFGDIQWRLSDVVDAWEIKRGRRPDKRLRGLCADVAHFTDVAQGELGNCMELVLWMGIVCNDSNFFDKSDVFPLGDTLKETGALVVRLWSHHLNSFRLVLVDDLLFPDAAGVKCRGERISLWPAMLMKSLAKLEGSFEALGQFGQFARTREEGLYLIGKEGGKEDEVSESYEREIVDSLRDWNLKAAEEPERVGSFMSALQQLWMQMRVPIGVSHPPLEGPSCEWNLENMHQYAVVGMLPLSLGGEGEGNKGEGEGALPETVIVSEKKGDEPQRESVDELLLLIANPWGNSTKDEVNCRFGLNSTELQQRPEVREWVINRLIAPGVTLPEGITPESYTEWEDRPSGFLISATDLFNGAFGVLTLHRPGNITQLTFRPNSSVKWSAAVNWEELLEYELPYEVAKLTKPG